MATANDSAQLASQARRCYVDMLLKGMPALVARVNNGARELLDKPAEYTVAQRRRDLVQAMIRLAGGWQRAMVQGLRHVLQHGVTASQPGDLPAPGAGSGLSLVENDVIEREILTSRLALAIMDRAGWEFTDLRARMAMLERRAELETHDMLRAHILARVVLDAWRGVGLSADDWREAQALLHAEFAALAEEAYHETNRWLLERRVMADVDLRPYIRRTVDSTGGLGGGGVTLHAPLRGGPRDADSGAASGFNGGSPTVTSAYAGAGRPTGAGPATGPTAATTTQSLRTGFGRAGQATTGYGHTGPLPPGGMTAPMGPGGARPTAPADHIPGQTITGHPTAASAAGRTVQGGRTDVGRLPPAAGSGGVMPPAGPGRVAGTGWGTPPGRPVATQAGGAGPADTRQAAQVGEETRMMTRAGPIGRGSDHAEAVLGRLNRLVGRHLPGFADTTQARPVTAALSLAINNAQQNLRRRLAPGGAADGAAGGPVGGTTGVGTSPATRAHPTRRMPTRCSPARCCCRNCSRTSRRSSARRARRPSAPPSRSWR